MPTFSESRSRQLAKRYEALKGMRSNWETQWQEISDFVIGRRDFITERTPGQRRMERVYDTTALLTSQLLAAGLASFLTNPATKWFDLRLEDSPMIDDDEVNFWLEAVRDRLLAVFSRGESGFSSQMDEVYQELVWFGTGVMFVEDKPGFGIQFSARPLAECYLAENSSGRVDTVIRKFKLTHRQASQIWGKDAPERVKKAVAQGKLDDSGEYIHAVVPAGEFNEKDQSKPWSSFISSLDEQDKFIVEGGFMSMPYLTPRWSTDPGEIYGRGPGITSLPDAKMLNQMSKTILKAAQKVVDPPLLVDDDGILAQLQTAPGSQNVQRSTSLRPDSVRPLLTNANIPIGVELIQQRQQQVRSAYHWELLQLIQDPRMTATQVIALSRNIQRLLSPLLGRMQVEFLEPMIDRVFDILQRDTANPLPPPPQVLQGGEKIKVEYVSPVARAQKANDADAIMRVVASAGEMAQINPDVLHNVDLDESIRFLADFAGAPRPVIRPRAEVVELRREMAAQQQEAEQRQQLKEVVETTAAAAPALAQAAEAGAPEGATIQ
jgi:hypothetical protein